MYNSVLVLAPHTDDGEFGCGGAIARFAEEGRQVYYVAFSSAKKSVPKGMPADILKREVRRATKILGIDPHNLILMNYPVREFPTYRQQILEDMISLRDKLNPDLVLLPSTNDTHQDHQTVSQEGFRAFKKISIIGYEMPYNNMNFSTSMFTVLTEGQMQKKLQALKCYRSQAGRIYVSDDFITGLARVRGTQIGVSYAEAFEVIRWVIK